VLGVIIVFIITPSLNQYSLGFECRFFTEIDITFDVDSLLFRPIDPKSFEFGIIPN
jgi:hypothetical protein